MRIGLCVALLALGLCFSHASASKLQLLGAESERIDGEYVIGFKSRDHFNFFRKHSDRFASNVRFSDDHRSVMVAFATLSDVELKHVERYEGVEYIYPNLRSSIVSSVGDDDEPPSWGLDRIDQRALPLDDFYEWQYDGEGVSVIVIDSGVAINHPDWAPGQASFVADCSLGPCLSVNDTGDDNGHGTHVAGTVASPTFGVARRAEILSIRVFDAFGFGSIETVVNGMIRALEYAQQNPGRRYVVNMSLRTPRNPTVDALTIDLWEAGVTVVAAAGNEAQPACNISPAGSERIITVAASNITDEHAYYSNWGSCVDLYAPGSAITSLDAFFSPNLTISGTSMAAPHVAGAAALLLSSPRGSFFTPDRVRDELVNSSTPGVIINSPSGTANLLLYSLDLRPDPWVVPAPAPSPGVPTPAPTFRPPLPNTGCILTDQVGHQFGPEGFEQIWNVSDVGACCDLCNERWQCLAFTFAEHFEEGDLSGSRCFLYRQPLDETAPPCPFCTSGNFNDSIRATPAPTRAPTLAPTPAPPIPDLFCDSFIVDSNIGKPNLVGNPSGDAIFRWHHPDGGDYTINTCSNRTDYDTYLLLFRDAGLTDLINENDDFCILSSQISGSLPPGEYYIVVEGFGESVGTFGLLVTCGTVPPGATPPPAPAPVPSPGPINGTCAGRCGTFNSTFPCQCDSLCETANDCCPDFEELCGDVGPTPPPVPIPTPAPFPAPAPGPVPVGECNCEDEIKDAINALRVELLTTQVLAVNAMQNTLLDALNDAVGQLNN